MAIETSAPRSRRALLAATVGGLGALIAQALGRPGAALAADGDVVTIGGSFIASSKTTIENPDGTDTVLILKNAGAGRALSAENTLFGIGVAGHSGSGSGVVGQSATGTGVEAHGGRSGVTAQGTRFGVFGEAVASDGAAVMGRSSGHSTGVLGYSGPFQDDPDPRPKTGVYGVANQDSGACGVNGRSPLGTGVLGESDTGFGVIGRSSSSTGVVGSSNSGAGVVGVASGGSGKGVAGAASSGIGVDGNSSSGVGVNGISTTGTAINASSDSGPGVAAFSESNYGVNGHSSTLVGVRGASNIGTGVLAVANQAAATALEAQGPVKFSTATLATIPAGSSSVAVSPGIDLTADSKVLCTLQSDPGTRSIRNVSSNPSTNSYTIFLSGRASTPVSVACFVIS